MFPKQGASRLNRIRVNIRRYNGLANYIIEEEEEEFY